VYQFGSVDILVNIAELPQGELLTSDIGAHMQRNDGAPLKAEGYTEDRILMVVHVPKGLRNKSARTYQGESNSYWDMSR
jgi:hypothetical protein